MICNNWQDCNWGELLAKGRGQRKICAIVNGDGRTKDTKEAKKAWQDTRINCTQFWQED
jgi:hypothetical protein